MLWHTFVRHYSKMATYDKLGKLIDRTKMVEQVRDFTDKCLRSGQKAVILIGENHDDSESRNVEMDVLKGLKGQSVALSLEFYERDVQPVLSEYLAGLIDYETFISDSRPPGNHMEYRPLIDHCKESKVNVFASNCPRRYSRMVGRHGRSKLEEVMSSTLTPDFYRVALPPLPYKKASEKYQEKFMEIMGVVSSQTDGSRLERMLDAQSLWDASMAHTISKALNDVSTVVHVCGYFHCQNYLGIGEHLPSYMDESKYETLTIVVFPEDPQDLSFKPEDHEGLCDYLVITDISKLV